ncbi:MAG: SGNH/GDSL hydrolase family protein [Clostridia bacterium]|nr:SGNH/GDSL hydrolase family protein [Clostridia bacterium]
MENFTIPEIGRTSLLEKYEWDNTWWHNNDDRDTPRILYLGDSISCGVRSCLNDISDGKYIIDGYGTSKGVDNPYLGASITLFAKQMLRLDAIIFALGGHGYHLDNESEFEKHYQNLCVLLKKEFPCVPVVTLSATWRRNASHTKIVTARNAVRQSCSEKYGFGYIDIYGESEKNQALLTSDGVHFTSEGYLTLAEYIKEKLKAYFDFLSADQKNA